MNTEKLKMMANFLDDLTIGRDESFRLAGSWISIGDCGTAACAIGWAVLKGKLPELTKSKMENWDDEVSDHRTDYGIEMFIEGDQFKGGWTAVRNVFGIKEEEAEFLFCADRYMSRNPSKELVARRIRDFVADGERNE